MKPSIVPSLAFLANTTNLALCKWQYTLEPLIDRWIKAMQPVAVLASLLFLSSNASAQVLSSIAPLELLARDLLPEGLQSASLLGANDSPHHYALKPQDMLRLRQAELFIWVGPQLETVLAKAVKQQVESGRLLTLHEGGTGEAHHHHEHRHRKDSHIWLSFTESADIASLIASRLVALYPAKQEQIERKLAALLGELEQERLSAKAEFSVVTQGFAVYHDAYAYYIDELGLKQLAYVSILPDQQLSLRQLYELKRSVKGGSCLMADVTELSAAQKLAKKIDLPVQPLDLLASNFKAPSNGSNFVAYMREIRRSFSECFVKAKL